MLQVGVAPTRTPSTVIGCVFPLDFYPAPLLPLVRQTHHDRGAAEAVGAGVGPLDEGDAVRPEVVVEQRRVLALEVGEAVEVEVGYREAAAAVALADREGG